MALMLAGFALIALIDLRPVIQRRSWHDTAAFLLLFFAALILAVLQVSGTEVPSIMLLLGNGLKALGLSY